MEELYSENPAMFRNHPFRFTFLVLLIPVFGAAAVSLGGDPANTALATASVAVLGAALLILMFWYVQTKAAKLSITKEHILYEVGLLSKTRTDIDVDNIRSVKVNQPFIKRIFGVGNIKIYTSGDEPEIVVEGLPHPNRIRELIQQLQND